MSLFVVTGTDTGVGKTFVTTNLLGELRRRGADAVGVKPIETGWSESTSDAAQLSVDLRGTSDAFGRELMVTEVAVADELAGAADLVMGKAAGVPVAVVRGIDAGWFRRSSVADEIVRPPADDLFR
jgi:coenzyme F420-0:L-glutamate ligase/coenzyme F420-1:gamma-L-glutamate ligase